MQYLNTLHSGKNMGDVKDIGEGQLGEFLEIGDSYAIETKV